MSPAADDKLGPSYLGALACELGEPQPIDSLLREGERPETIEPLRLLGLQTYLKASGSVAALAEASIRKTLEATGTAPETIDVALLATESYGESKAAADPFAFKAFRRDLYGALARTGVGAAYPMGVNLAACGNFVSAVQVARCLTGAGVAKTVLVVVVDRHPDGLSRVVPRVAVLSDAAATCIVSSSPMPGYKIDFVAQRATLTVNDVDMFTNFAAYTIEAARAMRQLGADFMRTSPEGFEAFRWIVTNNYTLSAIRGLLRQLGCDDKRVYVENVAKLSHANAADIPINLATLLQEKAVANGERVLAFGNGASAWALAGFTANLG